VAWDATLPPAELDALRILAERLGYFGRAESLVEARVLDGFTAIEANATPLAEGASLPQKTELVRLLAPMLPTAYDEWRDGFMAKAEAALGPKPTAAQKKKLPKLPDDLFAALQADSGDLQAAGWNLPPGAAYVNYTRDEKAFAPMPRIRKAYCSQLPTVARYAVVSTVSPRLTQAISVGNRVHEALCKWSDQASIFTGRDSHGSPLINHQHAHVFCESNGPRDAITHLSVWAQEGFDERACIALRRLNKVWGHGGHDLRLVLTALGQPDAFPDCRLFAKAKVWRSATPFVSTRHAKTFRDGRPKIDENGWQIGSAGHDLLRLLAIDPQTQGATIRKDASIEVGERALRCLQFQMIRHDGGGSRGNGDAGAYTITFTEPVTGPLAFGYGSHFSLGLFIPVEES
ncbi:MAG TPA: type I-U CRISPR-associated protein Csb2, partial [Terracidiphilus sp.]